MGARLLVLAGLVVIASGCESASELDALQARMTQLEVELAEKQAIAQNLNAYRRELEALEQRIAAANVPTQWDAADALVRINRAASGAVQKFQPNEAGAQVAVGGEGGPEGLQLAVAGLIREVPLARVTSAELHGRTWRIELVLETFSAPGASGAATSTSAAALPPINWRSGSRSEELRQRIAMTQRRTAELDKVLGEVVRIREIHHRNEKLLSALDDPNRAKRALPIIEAVFASRPPLVTDGIARLADGAIRVQIASGSKAAELGEALAGKARVVAFSDGPPASVELALPQQPKPGDYPQR